MPPPAPPAIKAGGPSVSDVENAYKYDSVSDVQIRNNELQRKYQTQQDVAKDFYAKDYEQTPIVGAVVLFGVVLATVFGIRKEPEFTSRDDVERLRRKGIPEAVQALDAAEKRLREEADGRVEALRQKRENRGFEP